MKKIDVHNTEVVSITGSKAAPAEIFEKTSIMDIQLAKSISTLLEKMEKFPQKEKNHEMKKGLDEIISSHSQEQAGDELFANGISSDQLSSTIDKYLAPKSEHHDLLELLPFSKPKNWNKDLAKELEIRINEGNKAKEVLDMADIESIPRETLIDLVKKCCDGKCASWVYVQSNIGLAVSAAKKFEKKNNSVSRFRFDLIQDTAITLFEASQKYKISRGSALSTFGTLFINGRIPRISKKYLTSFHVSDEELKKTFVSYCNIKTAEEKNDPKDPKDVEKGKGFEILTECISFEEKVNEDIASFDQSDQVLNNGNPAVYVDNKLFKKWIWKMAKEAMQENLYSQEMQDMYKKIVIEGMRAADFAEKFCVTERTINNWIKHMSAVIRKKLMKEQEGFRELAGYVNRPGISASTDKTEDKKDDTKQPIIQEEILKANQETQKSCAQEILPLAA